MAIAVHANATNNLMAEEDAMHGVASLQNLLHSANVGVVDFPKMDYVHNGITCVLDLRTTSVHSSVAEKIQVDLQNEKANGKDVELAPLTDQVAYIFVSEVENDLQRKVNEEDLQVVNYCDS